MLQRTIVTMPGDGIGKILLDETIRVLTAAGFNATYIEADIGESFWNDKENKNPLPERTVELIKKHKIGLFGAVTSEPKSDDDNELTEEFDEKEKCYFNPIVTLRQYFKLDICIRPCYSYKGNPLNFVRRNRRGEIEEPHIDVAIFRQNTEGLYGGVEWTNPRNRVYRAFKTHPKFIQNFGDVPKDELSISARIFTKKATNRILIAAFDYARKNGYKSVTICEKPNVIRETSGMMYNLAKEIQQRDYPEIELWCTNIDTLMMCLTKNPENYDVIVTGNMFGDIISDAFAGLIGGFGFSCSAQMSDSGVAIFEPTHRFSHHLLTNEIPLVNPIAMIESACLMLDYLQEKKIASNIRSAIASVILEGKVQTYDMKKMSRMDYGKEKGVASTVEMTNAIIDHLNIEVTCD